MKKTLAYELPDDPDSIHDELAASSASYSLSRVEPSDPDGDEFLLEATPDAFRQLARLFAQLADRGEAGPYLVHLGTTSEDAPQGPGWRIVATQHPDMRSARAEEHLSKRATDLREEAHEASQLLKDKVVAKIVRPRGRTVGILFRDGSRLYIDHTPHDLELSIEG